MLELCRKPLMCFFSCGLGGGNYDDELLWDLELKPHTAGEYSIAVVQANSSLEDQAQVFTSPFATLVGVYDGHGGPEASRFITNHLFSFIHMFSAEDGGLSEQVIKKAFSATEEEFLRMVKQSWISQPHIASVGSCCILGAISNDVLYVANLGDSRAVLGRKAFGGNEVSCGHNVVAERLSTDHNVGVEEVRKEVEALHPDDDYVVVNANGVWRIKGIIQRAVMTAEPSILTRKLKAEDLFLIFASDGLWEQLTDKEAVEIVSRSPRKGIAKRLVRAALEAVAKKKEMRYEDLKKIEKGVRRHFHDDITVIVIYLDHSQNSVNGSRPRHQGIYDSVNAPVDIYSINADR
ncbi:hypothetical protein Ahy_Scaffold1g106969 isoform B [Arachis hypogaea]|uniref:protein-serine/threonine phosphatase n=1 Tax=Arachis hypogaea TaxID=3818 RepID=A0A444WTQ8_ARAHY|nr:hypothetical protein Ahy_Scaffold1g106969 isoform B [Arachis hypogaea]